MATELTAYDLDRFCWLLVSWRNNFYPVEETADECLDAIDDPDDRQAGWEHGYHLGRYVTTNELMEHLYLLGINVMGRANRYTKVHREHDMEFRLPEEPDYYLATDNGAEVSAVTSTRFSDVDIESLGPAPYVPAGVEE